ncbi:MAG: hypothetical protein KF859_07025 [Phycisphaeraceae bacterium]|nr:hypothetical protein [Phycisphaeraceae bacterium]
MSMIDDGVDLTRGRWTMAKQLIDMLAATGNLTHRCLDANGGLCEPSRDWARVPSAPTVLMGDDDDDDFDDDDDAFADDEDDAEEEDEFEEEDDDFLEDDEDEFDDDGDDTDSSDEDEDEEF